MFKDKYTRIVLRKIEAIVFIFLQLFLQRAGKVFTNSSTFITKDVYFQCSLVQL